MSEGIEELIGVWSSDGSYYSVPIQDMDNIIAEIRRLRAENAELRASYERVEKYAQSLSE